MWDANHGRVEGTEGVGWGGLLVKCFCLDRLRLCGLSNTLYHSAVNTQLKTVVIWEININYLRYSAGGGHGYLSAAEFLYMVKHLENRCQKIISNLPIYIFKNDGDQYSKLCV